jgi:hypothetical protein
MVTQDFVSHLSGNIESAKSMKAPSACISTYSFCNGKALSQQRSLYSFGSTLWPSTIRWHKSAALRTATKFSPSGPCRVGGMKASASWGSSRKISSSGSLNKELGSLFSFPGTCVTSKIEHSKSIVHIVSFPAHLGLCRAR